MNTLIIFTRFEFKVILFSLLVLNTGFSETGNDVSNVLYDYAADFNSAISGHGGKGRQISVIDEWDGHEHHRKSGLAIAAWKKRNDVFYSLPAEIQNRVRETFAKYYIPVDDSEATKGALSTSTNENHHSGLEVAERNYLEQAAVLEAIDYFNKPDGEIDPNFRPNFKALMPYDNWLGHYIEVPDGSLKKFLKKIFGSEEFIQESSLERTRAYLLAIYELTPPHRKEEYKEKLTAFIKQLIRPFWYEATGYYFEWNFLEVVREERHRKGVVNGVKLLTDWVASDFSTHPINVKKLPGPLGGERLEHFQRYMFINAPPPQYPGDIAISRTPCVEVFGAL